MLFTESIIVISLLCYLFFHWATKDNNFTFLSFCVFQAVKRSRVKSKQRAQETQERVDALKKEIDETEKKLLEKKQRTKFLKELFLDTARSKSETLKRDIDLKKLLEDDDEGTT